jgi:hypothetical protein
MTGEIVLALTWAAAFALPLAAAETAAPVDLTRLAWLEGRWTGTTDGVSMEEQWTAPAGGSLLALHRDVKDGRTTSFEFLRIQTTAEGTFYFASPRSAPPTPFRLLELGDKKVVFENKEHPFPQRILYWLDGAGALHARIEGPRDGKTVGEEWTWTRAH